MYRGITVSLLYLTASKLDIVFSVGMCARFLAAPKESHLKAAKRILRDLKGMHDLVLFYPTRDTYDLTSYANANYASFLVDRESTSGMTHFLGSTLISWETKKQNYVALSKAEAELLLLLHVVRSFCGSSNNWNILVYVQIPFFYVIMPVQ
ncbi:uncharacterized protein LOC107003629 [Solanum pennellii]|uniref:Uncharacterized protein LOC107003629 n=1 Tax=Solanum pennellii TaxID=28526 RepID=A0ABM1FIT0_SOLPN|nr:uncharacterized protein LOC107003629 [Solanum pennellii]